MGNFNDFDDIVRVPDLLLALAIGIEALLAMLQLNAPWGVSARLRRPGGR